MKYLCSFPCKSFSFTYEHKKWDALSDIIHQKAFLLCAVGGATVCSRISCRKYLHQNLSHTCMPLSCLVLQLLWHETRSVAALRLVHIANCTEAAQSSLGTGGYCHTYSSPATREASVAARTVGTNAMTLHGPLHVKSEELPPFLLVERPSFVKSSAMSSQMRL